MTARVPAPGPQLSLQLSQPCRHLCLSCDCFQINLQQCNADGTHSAELSVTDAKQALHHAQLSAMHPVKVPLERLDELKELELPTPKQAERDIAC